MSEPESGGDPTSANASDVGEGEEVLATARGGDGAEYVLRRRGEVVSVERDGREELRSDAPRCEEALVDLVFAPLVQRDDTCVIVAGLGMGRTLRRVLDSPGVVRVDVIEIAEPIIAWNRGPLALLHGDALADPRVRVHTGDLLDVLKDFRHVPPAEERSLPGVPDGWLAVILDLDRGPGDLLRPDNAGIYSDDGLQRLEGAMRHGGVLGLWSRERDLALLRRLHARFVNVAELAVPVDVPGGSSLDYVYRARRAPQPRQPGIGTVAQA